MESMSPTEPGTITAFAGERRIATGSRLEVALAVKRFAEEDGEAQVLIFDDVTSRPVEFDLRGSLHDVRHRLGHEAKHEAQQQAQGGADEGGHSAPVRRGRGRPKLGVVAKEVTLLPRHWAWLGSQRGGASATLRRLVEEARRANEQEDQVRAARDSTYRFSAAIAGNQPGFEEAMRALFAGDRARFREEIGVWPHDVREYAERISEGGFASVSASSETGRSGDDE
jgi:uncharacterized protein